MASESTRRPHRPKRPARPRKVRRRAAPPPDRTPDWLAALAEDLVDAGSREHYADAGLYDYEYRRRRSDVTFYRDFARRRLGGPGRILELGAGTGRVTIPLVRDGHEVVALDQSDAMLDRLRSRVDALPVGARNRVTTLRGDLRNFTIPGQRFPLAIAVFNVLEHLYTRGELTACLERVAAHLEDGGAFVFDVQLPDLPWLSRDPNRRWAKTRFTDPSSGRAMYYSTNHDYDPISQICLIRLFYDPVDGTPGRVVKLSQRKFFPAELEALVAHAGFRVTDRFGDFSFAPLAAGAESQVLVCEPVRRR